MSSEPFNPELTRILDRVYGKDSTKGAHREENLVKAAAIRTRRRRDAKALEDALEGLRQLRERSQGLSELKDEIEYLRREIEALRALDQEIARLRAELARPFEESGSESGDSHACSAANSTYSTSSSDDLAPDCTSQEAAIARMAAPLRPPTSRADDEAA